MNTQRYLLLSEIRVAQVPAVLCVYSKGSLKQHTLCQTKHGPSKTSISYLATCLKSQPSGGRGTQIAELEPCLVYKER